MMNPFSLAQNPQCLCDPIQKGDHEFSYVIGALFADCVYTPAEYLSFFFGIASILFWLVAQFPQLVLSWRLGRVDSLSKELLYAWIFGDAANIIGCYLTKQLQTQLFTAWYFFLMDALTLGQYLYYERLGLAGTPKVTPQSPAHALNQHSGILAARSGKLQGLESDDLLGYTSGAGYSMTTVQGETMRLLGTDHNKASYASNSDFALGAAVAAGSASSSSSSSSTSSDSWGSSLNSQVANPLPGIKEVDGNVSNNQHQPQNIGRRTPGGYTMYAVLTLGISFTALASLGYDSYAPAADLTQNAYADSAITNYAHIASAAPTNGVSRVLLSIDETQSITPAYPRKQLLPPCVVHRDISFFAHILGTIASWISGILYMGSRVPQIIKNKRRHEMGFSVEGLSKAMFTIAVLANACYGLSIFLRSPEIDLTFWLVTMSYLVGSLGTLLLDVVVLVQTVLYADPNTSSASDDDISTSSGEEHPVLTIAPTPSRATDAHETTTPMTDVARTHALHSAAARSF